MSHITRRHFLKLAGGAGSAGALGVLGLPAWAQTAERSNVGAHVVVVGGGFGGATCAKYLRRAGVDVTLVEPNTQFITCPFSSSVIGGLQQIDAITHNYDALKNKHGATVVHDSVTAIDPITKTVTLKSGKTLKYDRLVVAPGIDFKWDAMPGYNEQASSIMPHAWKAGAQTLLLRSQLEAMRNGGTVIIVSPANPYRCPPGPYERASMIAYYLKNNKPKSKVLILDAKEKFAKQPLFMEGWSKLYGSMIEWVSATKGGRVTAVDTKTMTVMTEIDKHKGDVVNMITAQTAGSIALASGLADDTGFCSVDPRTFESRVHKGIHVVGDSCIAGTVPKSGIAASAQAKMCAAAIAAIFRGEPIPDASFINACYSLVAPNYGISMAGVYRVSEKGIIEIPDSGGPSPREATDAFREAEANYARGWYAGITSDTWG